MSKLLVGKVMCQGRGGSGSKREEFSWEERGTDFRLVRTPIPLRQIGMDRVEDSSLLHRFLSFSVFLAFVKPNPRSSTTPCEFLIE